MKATKEQIQRAAKKFARAYNDWNSYNYKGDERTARLKMLSTGWRLIEKMGFRDEKSPIVRK